MTLANYRRDIGMVFQDFKLINDRTSRKHCFTIANYRHTK